MQIKQKMKRAGSTESAPFPYKKLRGALAGLFALTVWQIAAMIMKNDILLASPLQVAVRLVGLLKTGAFWQTLAFSCVRVLGGFMLGLVLGVLAAGLAARFSLMETLLMPFVVCIKSVPVASFVILCLIWLTADRLSIFITLLMVFPVVYTNVLNGVRNTDRKMLQMAQVFRLSFGRRLKYVYLPQVKPYLLSACTIALGMSWKAGIAAEVIGLPDGSIGEKLYMAKIYFETVDLFAWTTVIVLVSRVMEKLTILGIEALLRLPEELQ